MWPFSETMPYVSNKLGMAQPQHYTLPQRSNATCHMEFLHYSKYVLFQGRNSVPACADDFDKENSLITIIRNFKEKLPGTLQYHLMFLLEKRSCSLSLLR